MSVPVVGLGAGGHAKVVIEILSANVDFEVIGLLDARAEMKGAIILGIPVLGDDGMVPELVKQGVKNFFLGAGSVGDATVRRRLCQMAFDHGMQAVNAIHPSSVVSASAKIGNGVTILAGAIINAGVSIGDNVIVNTGAIVEHDCVIGDYVHIATGARLAGGVQVRQEAHVGIGAAVRQGILIGEGAVVGAGAVVVKNVSPATTVIGVPARPMPHAKGSLKNK